MNQITLQVDKIEEQLNFSKEAYENRIVEVQEKCITRILILAIHKIENYHG